MTVAVGDCSLVDWWKNDFLLLLRGATAYGKRKLFGLICDECLCDMRC